MTKSLITSTLLVSSIALIAIGINTGNTILIVIGGICAGIYNSIITKAMEE